MLSVRLDAPTEQLRDVNITVSTVQPTNSSPPQDVATGVCAYLDGARSEPRHHVTCNTATSGRYLSVQIMGMESTLTLCEVKVYAFMHTPNSEPTPSPAPTFLPTETPTAGPATPVSTISSPGLHAPSDCIVVK